MIIQCDKVPWGRNALGAIQLQGESKQESLQRASSQAAGFSEKTLELGTDGEEDLAASSDPHSLICEMVIISVTTSCAC